MIWERFFRELSTGEVFFTPNRTRNRSKEKDRQSLPVT